MADAPAPDADPLQSAEVSAAPDDLEFADPLVDSLHAARDAKPAPDDSDIAADDAGATAMAEEMGTAIKQG